MHTSSGSGGIGFLWARLPLNGFFLLKLQRGPNPDSHLSLKIPLGTWFQGVSLFDSQVRHRELGTVTTFLCRDEDIGLVSL